MLALVGSCWFMVFFDYSSDIPWWGWWGLLLPTHIRLSYGCDSYGCALCGCMVLLYVVVYNWLGEIGWWGGVLVLLYW